MIDRTFLVSFLTFCLSSGLTFLYTQNLTPSLLVGLITSPTSYAVVKQLEKTSKISTNSSSYPTEKSSHSSKVAVFWDYENVRVSVKDIKMIEEILQERGDIAVKKVYSDWTQENSEIAQSLEHQGFEVINVSRIKANATDFKIVVDCNNVAQDLNIEQLIIISTDKDYLPLIHSLKNSSKKVTIIGRNNSIADELLTRVDDFIALENYLDQKNVKTISYEDAVACLVEAVKTAQKSNNPATLGRISQLMRANADFNYAGYSSIETHNQKKFARFKDFLIAVEKEGKIKLKASEKLNDTEILLVETATTTSKSSPKSDKIINQTIDYKDAVACLIETVKIAQNSNQPATLGRLDKLMRANKNFDYQGHSSIRSSEQIKFNSFKRFLIAVEAEGKIKLQASKQFNDTEILLIETAAKTSKSLAKSDKIINKTIDYKDAVACLIEAVKTAENSNKPATLARLDQLMRDNKNFDYQGHSSIRSSEPTKFASFKFFLTAVEKDGKIKLHNSGKSKEIKVLLT